MRDMWGEVWEQMRFWASPYVWGGTTGQHAQFWYASPATHRDMHMNQNVMAHFKLNVSKTCPMRRLLVQW